MAMFKVTERQTIVVAYYVEADDAAMAREHVTALGCTEYDELVENRGTDILDVQKMSHWAAEQAASRIVNK